MTPEELQGKIIIGEFLNREDNLEYTKRYDQVIERAKAKA